MKFNYQPMTRIERRIEQRQTQILNDLADGSSFDSLGEMALAYGVSESTLSKDLNALEFRGLIYIPRNAGRAMIVERIRAVQR